MIKKTEINLNFKKETIANLDKVGMKKIHGGIIGSMTPICTEIIASPPNAL
ncbi:MAG: hypothetical protein GY765_30955 [bacterium]|nr:hypothetical protein [bacterium]